MDEHRRLLKMANLLEGAAETLTQFAHLSQSGTELPKSTRQAACDLAMQLMPEADSIANVAGKDTRRLRHAAASSLLRLASLARTRGATSSADAAAATQLALELIAVAEDVRIEAAGLE